jgi:H+/Cl- antiporter ClcA
VTNREPDFLQNVQDELSNGRNWLDRSVVLAYAILAGLSVVGFTLLSEYAFSLFESLHHTNRWFVLIWIPLCTASIVWATRRWFAGASGSGIPQVMAALDPAMPKEKAGRFVSLKLTLGKIGLTSAGLMAGLSIGREGPSVQIAAGIMQHAKVMLGPKTGITRHALLVAGGSAGIAAAFHAPLAGVVFAIEELSRKMDSRNSGLMIAAIVLGGLMAVSTFGNLTYFGRIQVPRLGWEAFIPGLMVAMASGLLGGLFSRVMVASLTGSSDRFSALRTRFPVRFAAAGGLVIAIIGLVTGGATYGAGSEAVKHMLAGNADVPEFYVTLKFIATWLTAWCGVPGGIFAPSLSIGAGIGHNVAAVTGSTEVSAALIAMGMAGFLAAVTQAPLTSFIIVMEMVDGHAMVLSLMTCAMVASLVSRMISRPLYTALADHMVNLATMPLPVAEPAEAVKEVEVPETPDAPDAIEAVETDAVEATAAPASPESPPISTAPR